MIDRSEVSRALAKAIAYHDCGKPEKAQLWATKLVSLLQSTRILTDDAKLAYINSDLPSDGEQA